MAKIPYYLSDNNDTFNIKKEFSKYISYWPWFIISFAMFFSVAYFYLKYTSVTYKTTGKIKILDDSSKSLELPGDIASFFESSKVNLENEIEVIKSHRLLSGVVESLKLNVIYIENGKIKNKELWKPPFRVYDIDSINNKTENYFIKITDKGYQVSNSDEKVWNIDRYTLDLPHENLPFLIKPEFMIDLKMHVGKEYSIIFTPVSKATAQLSSHLKVTQIGKNSDILSLSMISDNNSKSEAIVNEVIEKFNLDGILDRQLVSQRTIDFVDERFIYLTKELDSIENGKKGFKQKSNLSDIELDTEYTIIRKTNTLDEVLRLETQLEVSRILKQTLNTKENFDLLPTNIGLENSGVNKLIDDYNKEAIYRNRIKESAGSNNPLILNNEKKLKQLKLNILSTLTTSEKQIESSLNKAENQKKMSSGFFNKIPEKAKILRAIERQQKIKETLYVLLLEKREEAAINLAITSPSIKVVDQSVTNPSPVFPKKRNIYFIALSTGFILPFLVLYISFFVDSKLRTKEDLITLDTSISIIGEVPYSKKVDTIKNRIDRSVLSESFKVARTNVNHYFNTQIQIKKEEAKVVFVTSSIKGEGKSFTSANMALTYLNLNKKVLLVGADFRNPQLLSYFNLKKTDRGLSDYLTGRIDNIKEIIFDYEFDENLYLDIMLSGKIPPNPDELLTSKTFSDLLSEMKLIYDFIIVDTAPTIPVTDTLLIAPLADITLYVIKSGFTDKKLLPYINELATSGKLKNVNILLNGIVYNRLRGYRYNYGYNYGYESVDFNESWYLKFWNRNKV